MSAEQLKAFLEMVKTDPTLQEKLNSAQSPDEVVSIAKEHGHNFTADKLNELNNGELEHIAGGDKQDNKNITGVSCIVCIGNV
jgi:predicted ribosomally synthesized peptide with nif11-like leader